MGSQYCVACCLSEGRGTTKDDVEAKEWLQRSAAAGFRPACRMLQQYTGAGASQDMAGVEQTASLSGLAARIAEQLSGLEDDEAEDVLNELLTEVPWLLDDHGSDEEESVHDDSSYCQPLLTLQAS